MSPLKPFLPLTPNFFGLNNEYKEAFLNEIAFAMEILNIPYSEIMKMSVMERRYWLGRKQKHYDDLEENKEKGGTNKMGGKTVVSGEAIKHVIQNKSINGKSIPGL